MAAPYEHKRGKSFIAAISFPPATYPDGYFVDWVLRAQVRKPDGTLLQELACTWDDPATTRLARLTALNTRAWTAGPARIDFILVRAGDQYTDISNTVTFLVTEPVTEQPDV